MNISCDIWRKGRLPVVNFLTVVTSTASAVSDAAVQRAIAVMDRVRRDGHRAGER
jgi:hypothetical protein